MRCSNCGKKKINPSERCCAFGGYPKRERVSEWMETTKQVVRAVARQVRPIATPTGYYDYDNSTSATGSYTVTYQQVYGPGGSVSYVATNSPTYTNYSDNAYPYVTQPPETAEEKIFKLEEKVRDLESRYSEMCKAESIAKSRYYRMQQTADLYESNCRYWEQQYKNLSDRHIWAQEELEVLRQKVQELESETTKHKLIGLNESVLLGEHSRIIED